MELIDALSLIQKKGIEILNKDDCWEVHKHGCDYGVCAEVMKDTKKITCYVTGVYNSCCDYAEINMDDLEDVYMIAKKLIGE